MQILIHPSVNNMYFHKSRKVAEKLISGCLLALKLKCVAGSSVLPHTGGQVGVGEVSSYSLTIPSDSGGQSTWSLGSLTFSIK